MQCPACSKSLLITIEYEEVELDFCEQCRGVWLDTGELELLSGPGAIALMLTGAAATAPARRRCPHCAKKMDVRATVGATSVVVDVCPRGCGMWLDQGELEQVLTLGGAWDANGKLAAWLREVFGGATRE